MPTVNLGRTLASARARVAALEKKAAARNRELASLPRKYGYSTLAGLSAGISAALRQVGPKKAVAARPRKGGVKAKAKPDVAEALPPPSAVRPAPAGIDRLPSALRKAAGEVVRVKMTPALFETIRDLTEKKKTVAHISLVTGLGASTIFRVRAKRGLKALTSKTATVVAKAKPPAKKKATKKVAVKKVVAKFFKNRKVKAKAKPIAKPLGVVKARALAKAKPPARKVAKKAPRKAKKATKKKK